MLKVLHLSRTDISRDSRILKEMAAIATSFPGITLAGLGASISAELSSPDKSNLIDIKIINLSSDKWLWLPKIIRHICVVFELSWKMFWYILKFSPDLIHAHDIPVLPIACISKLCIKTKIIYDAHELESDKNGTTWLGGKLTYIVEKILWRYVDYFITVSDSIALWYQDHFGKKITKVVLNSPDFIEQDNKRVALLLKTNYLHHTFNIPSDRKIFLYIGELGSGRMIDKMLEVFADEAVNAHIVFLGNGSLKAKIKQISAQTKNIHYHAPVMHTEILGVALGADYGLCLIEKISLSDYFCLPNKLFEYVFSGLPVLCSDFPDIATVVDKYHLGFKVPLNVDAIKAQVINIDQINGSNRINVTNLYELSWLAQVEKINEVYSYFLK